MGNHLYFQVPVKPTKKIINRVTTSSQSRYSNFFCYSVKKRQDFVNSHKYRVKTIDTYGKQILRTDCFLIIKEIKIPFVRLNKFSYDRMYLNYTSFLRAVKYYEPELLTNENNIMSIIEKLFKKYPEGMVTCG